MQKAYIYKSKKYGYEIEFEVNNWAERSLISLTTKHKESVIFTTINLGKELPEIDFLPLTVDYEEKFYAVGKIYGSRFIRREGKPSISAILNARLIDRSIRPIISPYFKKQLHINNIVLSYDFSIDPGVLSLLSTSVAIHLLGVPSLSPIGGVSIIYKNGEVLVNSLSNDFDFNLVLSGTENKINMIEFEGKEIKEDLVLKFIEIGLDEIKEIVNFIRSLPQISKEEVKLDESLYKESEKILLDYLEKNNLNLEKKLFSLEEGDRPWQEVFDLIENEESFNELKPYIRNSLVKIYKKIFQSKVLKDKIRPDGRGLKDIRPLEAKINLLPRVHGSALFMRGLTHILSTVTLASPGEELWLREIEFEGFKRFLHHYNFPPFSTGEIGSQKTISRREIGHGELVEKALRNLIPSQEEFPYTIRVVSEVLSSNGSTSMGSVCASSLALMAAGVPLKKHVAGISVGMVYEDDFNYELLTDIQGPEDFFGAMDFKIAGTEEGITAIQLDVKIEGLNLNQIKEAFLRGKEARLFILDFMKKIIEKPLVLSEYAPRIEVIKIDPTKIGLVIGTGGKTINEIIGATNVKIDIQPDGTLYIIGDKNSNFELVKNWIKGIADAFKIGELVKGKVIKILPFGAILELSPNRTALLHISEIADKKIENIENEIKIGEEYWVLIKNISQDGKISVSLKDARK